MTLSSRTKSVAVDCTCILTEAVIVDRLSRTFRFSSTALLLLRLAIAPASADSQADTWCNGGPGVSLDQQISGCTTIIQSGKNVARALNERAFAYLKNRETDKVIADFDQLIQLEPDFSDDFAMRGIAYNVKREYDRAIQDFDEAIRLEPNNAEAFEGRCDARAMSGKGLEAGLSDCNEALRLKANDALTLSTRGFVYLRLGQFDKSIADTNADLDANPKDASSLYVRGLAKRRSGDVAGGDADIAAAKAFDPKIADRYARYGVTP